MRIILTEINGDRRLNTREFDQPIVTVGRDPERCSIVFDQAKWLMVSRLHAEFRFENGQYFIVDLKSRQGTLLDNVPVNSPTPVRQGSKIQFGDGGPVLIVDATDASEQSRFQAATPRVQEVRPASGQPAKTTNALSTPSQGKNVPAALILESGQSITGSKEFSITRQTTTLGRDTTADVQVEGAAPVVSRRHAEITQRPDGSFVVTDLQSFNGTLVNGQRISQPTQLAHSDVVQLSVGGPILRFVLTRPPSRNEASPGAEKRPAPRPGAALEDIGSRTIVFQAGVTPAPVSLAPDSSLSQPVLQRAFDDKGRVSVGREPDNDIQLDALVISNHHARFMNTEQGVVVQDAGSTNGVYLNGNRVAGWQQVAVNDVVQIGPFVLTANLSQGVSVYDTRSQTRLDALEVTQVVSKGSGKQLTLLDHISLAIEPNEFVGLLGPSGAGKSLLMNALIGTRKPTNGRVLINNFDLYQHLASLKQAIGHVPQDDIIHRELTVYQTLFYVARLRLSRDVRQDEIDQIISEVLEVTGLVERRNVQIAQLSGGQRKRVSIAVELITKPSLIFLDEPTSGLDPATEERIMKLFRQIAESGRTVVLTTHAMENVHLFDKVALLMRGRLVFYGTPQQALQFVGAGNFIGLYSMLEQPMEKEIAQLTPPSAKASKADTRTYNEQRNQIAEQLADQWRTKFLETPEYRENISVPLGRIAQSGPSVPASRRRRGILDSIRQWSTLVRRYTLVLLSDKVNLAILFGQAPIIALLTYLVVSKDDTRDFPFFVLALVPLWFGISVAAREIVKERTIYKRERMVNLSLLPYIGSKLFALSGIVCLQCLLLFATLKLFHLAGVMYVPGVFGGLPQLLVMILTGVVGITLGLFVSALVRTSEIATSIVPLLLIPQILFCGLVGVPFGAARVVGTLMPATWSFDELKQLSSLDTLRQEGSKVNGVNVGRGLFKHTEEENDKRLQDARSTAEDQKRQAEKNLKDYERRMKEYLNSVASGHGAGVSPPVLPEVHQSPSIPDVKKLGEDFSEYVTFKHPWGGVFIDAGILMAMFFSLLIMTLIAMRTRDSQ